jgi:hypothetical protein
VLSFFWVEELNVSDVVCLVARLGAVVVMSEVLFPCSTVLSFFWVDELYVWDVVFLVARLEAVVLMSEVLVVVERYIFSVVDFIVVVEVAVVKVVWTFCVEALFLVVDVRSFLPGDTSKCIFVAEVERAKAVLTFGCFVMGWTDSFRRFADFSLKKCFSHK